jgi:hypothetical protein
MVLAFFTILARKSSKESTILKPQKLKEPK